MARGLPARPQDSGQGGETEGIITRPKAALWNYGHETNKQPILAEKGYYRNGPRCSWEDRFHFSGDGGAGVWEGDVTMDLRQKI